MKNIIYILLLTMFSTLFSCSDDKSEEKVQEVELELEILDVALLKDKSTTVNITSGNGNYTVASSNKDIITAEVVGNVITITSTTSQDRAEAIVVITDSRFKRATINVTVAKEFDLLLDVEKATLELDVEGDDRLEVHIKEGNLDYTIEVIEGKEVVSIDTERLKSKNRFTIKALSVGDAKLEITDRLGKKSQLTVQVLMPEKVTLSKSAVTFDVFQKTETIEILSGVKNFKPIVSHPRVVQVEVRGDKIFITSSMSGKTSIVIQDSKGQQSQPIEVEVTAVKSAMNLGSAYFGHATFLDIAAVDNSIRNCKQVTFEMLCKVTGYRGLQTFMGLEGNLIIRGKNDDYKDTHPIEIAGLGDNIMLESSSSFDLNQWMHLALVVNCSASNVEGKYKLYINGQEDKLLVRRNDRTHDKVDLVSSNDGNRFEIGRSSGQDWRALRGIVSEARIWTTARTAEQIKENICTLNDAQTPDLLTYWVFSASDETNFIQDVNGGKYCTNLTLSSTKGDYSAVKVPSSVFVEDRCIQ